MLELVQVVFVVMLQVLWQFFGELCGCGVVWVIVYQGMQVVVQFLQFVIGMVDVQVVVDVVGCVVGLIFWFVVMFVVFVLDVFVGVGYCEQLLEIFIIRGSFFGMLVMFVGMGLFCVVVLVYGFGL